MGEQFEWMTCINCGVRWAMPAIRVNYCRSYGGSIWCPNGHKQGWYDDDVTVEKQRRQLDRIKQQIAQKDDAIREAQEKVRLAEAARARLEKRANAGVCPCCNRTFANVARHMKTKHPEVVPLKRKRA